MGWPMRGKPMMKTRLISIAWVIPMVVVVYAILNPVNGVIWQSPTAAFGIALIGMGMMKHGLDKKKADLAQVTSANKH